ncbi:MAG: oligosaccharide flippase family protein [Marinomonas sp.]
MNAIAAKLKKPSGLHPFIKGVLAYGSAEAFTRIVRLAAILVVSRQVSPEMLGTAALALSIFELIRVLANVGIGQRIIVAGDDEVEAISQTAHRLFWIVCSAVCALQLLTAALTWTIWQAGEAAAMLAVLSAVYLFMPAGLVQIFRAMRLHEMGATAQVAALQNGADCVLTLILVLIWPSAWAIVLPKVLTAPIWLILARRTFTWRADQAIAGAPYSAFRSFGPAILGSELLGAARLHGDKLLIGAMLGTEALGLYYFAFNAGLGIAQSFVAACNIVLFPHLAHQSSTNLEREFRASFFMGLAFLIPLVAAQALLAPYYVPVVFGEHWEAAAPYLAILSCAALPLYAGSLLGARHRASGNPYAETSLMALGTVAALLGLVIGAKFSLAAACTGFGAGLAAVFLTAATIQLSCNSKKI